MKSKYGHPSVLHPDAKQWIEEVETIKDMLEDNSFEEQRGDAAKEVSAQKYLMLTNRTRGQSKNIIMATTAPNGFKAWRELVRTMDPRTCTNKISVLTTIQSPEKRAMTEQEFLEMWKRWEHDLADYEIKYGIIEDSTK